MINRTLSLALFVLIATCAGVSAADWQTDYAKALQMAKSQNKRVLLDFTGSDGRRPRFAPGKQGFLRAGLCAQAGQKLGLGEGDFPHGQKQSAELKKTKEKRRY